MDEITVKYNLSTVRCFDEADGPGDAEPYLWTVFFKIDGDTVFVNEQLKLQGTATVVGTPGNHGNLGDKNVVDNENVPIPTSIGQFQTVLRPIPVKLSPGTTVGGSIGCVAVLMEEDSTPDGAVAKGHKALNEALQNELNKVIPTLGISKPEVTEEEKKKLTEQIKSAVKSAIKSEVNVWNVVWGFISFGNSQDDHIGTALFDFSHGDLEEKVKNSEQTFPLSQKWDKAGSWALEGRVTISKRLYDAVWRQTGGGEHQVYGWKFADFKATYDKLWKEGWRLHIFNTYTENGQRLHDAVWRKTDRGENQVYGWGFADFSAAYQKLWKDGWRLEILNAYQSNGI